MEEIIVADALISLLVPRDVCRLASTCQSLRHAARHIWSRLPGYEKVGATSAERKGRYCIEWDDRAGMRATLLPGRRSQATLRLPPCAPVYRVAAVHGAVPARLWTGRRVSWTIAMSDTTLPPGFVLWAGLCCARVPHADGSGAAERLDSMSTPRLLAPFARTGAAGSIAERFAASDWAIVALGSNGFLWGAGVGGTSFCPPWMPGGELHGSLRITIQAECSAVGAVSVSFVVGDLPARRAVKRMFPRGSGEGATFPLVYPLVHVTDISRRYSGSAGASAAAARNLACAETTVKLLEVADVSEL